MKYELYFTHDAHAFEDMKIKRLVKEFDYAGYGRFWRLVELLVQNENYEIEVQTDVEYEILQDELHFQSVAECKEFIHSCVHKYKLFEIENGKLFSNSLKRRMEKRDAYRRKFSEGGKKGMASRWKNQTEKTVQEQPQEIEATPIVVQQIGAKPKPDWYYKAFPAFTSKYPQFEKSFISAPSVEKAFMKAIRNSVGVFDEDKARTIVHQTEAYNNYINQLPEDQRKYELKSATNWLEEKGWTNNYVPKRIMRRVVT